MGTHPDTSTTSNVSPSACVACGSRLHEVGLKTVKHLLVHGLGRTVHSGRFLYCPNIECDVIYVEAASDAPATSGHRVFHRADLKDRARASATGRDRLVCHCFGYTAGDIEQDARSGEDLIPAAIAAEVRAGFCACEVLNPSGG